MPAQSNDAGMVLRALASAPRNEYVEGSKLAADTGLEPDRINDALALLVDVGHANWIKVWGTAPFDFAKANITARGRQESQRLSQLSAAAAPTSADALASAPSTVRLFISHCWHDRELAAQLAALFRGALNVPSSAIRCTSVAGYRLPGGADTDEQLRREVNDVEAVVGIVSHASVLSTYVLFELGARWGAGRQMIPLLAPGTPTSILGGPLAGLNALRTDDVSQIHQLLEEVAATLSLKLESLAVYDHQLRGVANMAPRPEDSHAADTTRASDRDSDLPSEAKDVLKVFARRDDLAVVEVAHETGLSVRRVEYYLDVCRERELVDNATSYVGDPTKFYLTSEGRKYLFEHDMLE